ncbi:MAG TPA: serine/threonine-protein kinase [Planctomycetota bacterium]|nr:serine/threonine-protein kinase [Planctomycetota bacterium]HRR80534.1 serine/threonine-protein kinase [Planctomycetota bacterium]HRT94383.1 serine/threonine-protein kinase [Planctomycetota bacterium]
MPEAKPAERVGDFEFLDLLAVGGMGQLWRVRHVKLDAIYVAKVLRPDLRSDPEFAARFLREARLVARFRHPNVVQVFGFDEEHMLYFMEYVEGTDLDRLMRVRKNLTFNEKRTIIEVVADTIGHAHRQFDLIHRDIKPSNVLVAIAQPDDPILQSHIKLTDFGIARVLSLNQRVTMSSGMVMGTVQYMAPEQFEGEAAKESDVYSIGVLYYQLLTGVLPFTGPTAFVIRDKHRSEIPPAPHKVNPDVPLVESMTVMRCLEKDPTKRFRDAAELHEHLGATQGTAHTVVVPRRRSAPAADAAPGTDSGMVERTEQIERTHRGTTRHGRRTPIRATAASSDQVTERTIPAALAPVTERTIPASLEPVTERTISAEAAPAADDATAAVLEPVTEAAPTRRRRPLLWLSLGLVGAALLAAGIIAALPRKGAGTPPVGPGTALPPTTAAPPTAAAQFLSAKDLAAARSLEEARRILDRLGERVDAAPDPQAARAQLAGYRDLLTHLSAAAIAVGDGKCDEAERTLRNADMALERIDGIVPGELPKDFLFRHTLSVASGQARNLAAQAARLVEVLEPVATSRASVQYMLERYKAASAAVLESLAFSPGCSAWKKIKNGAGEAASLEPLLQGFGNDAPPPIALLQQYLGRLDALAKHAPTADQEPLYRTAVVRLLDDLSGTATRFDASPWAKACLGADDIACLGTLERLWREAHQTRLAAAAQLCHKLAAAQEAKAQALPPTLDRAGEARQLFSEAEEYANAVLKAAHVPDAAKAAAAALLSTASARQAMWLFCAGPRGPENEDQHFVEVRKLLGRGLDELPGCASDVAAHARILRDMLTVVTSARTALAASLRENFGAQAPFGGQTATLFAALNAFEPLAKEASRQPDHPCRRAALEPFLHLRVGGPVAGYTLPNAAAAWLLANAAQAAERGKYSDASHLLGNFQLEAGKEAQGAESPLKRLLPEPVTAKAGELLKLVQAFDDSRVPAGAPADRWKKVWEQRLAAQPLLALDIPSSVAAGSLPARFEGQENQCEGLYSQMRSLLDHCRARLGLEQEVRRAETEAAKLVIHAPDGVKPNPATATREAVAKSLEALRELRSRVAESAKRGVSTDDHPERLTSIERDLAALPAQTNVAELQERVGKALAKPDPRAALDELRAGGVALGRMAEASLTRQAMDAWVKMAIKAMADQDYPAAGAIFKAIRSHEQVVRFKDDPAVAAAYEETSRPLHYCEGHAALAGGAQNLAAALGEFFQAAPYRDADAIAKQIAPLQEAQKLCEKEPLRAVGSLERLLEQNELHAVVRSVAEKALGELRAKLLTETTACTQAFSQAFARGGWEDFVDRAAVPAEDLERLKAFLDQAEGIEVEQPEPPVLGELVPEKHQALLRSKRVLRFRYRLPEGATVPVTLEQAIVWTLRLVPPDQRKGRNWVIAGWEAR